MAANKALSASLEDYLEAIFHIVARKRAARASDIARRLKVSGSSVTGALRTLAEKGLVNYAPYDLITLTSQGRKIAADVVRRHTVLRDFFVRVLAVSEADAERGACKMEHVAPREIVQRLVRFVEFMERCPRAGSSWIEKFGQYCSRGQSLDDCRSCVQSCIQQFEQARLRRFGGGKVAVALSELKPGQKGRIVKVRARGEAGRRIVDMGVTAGTIVEVQRVAPLGDPIELKVKGYHLSLRKEEAAGITVEPL